MLPALHDGQLLIVEMLSYRRRDPRPGEVVIFTTASGRTLIKRVARLTTAGAVYVLGDNAAESNDSRRFGAVPRTALMGRAVFCYWPPADWGTIDTPPPRLVNFRHAVTYTLPAILTTTTPPVDLPRPQPAGFAQLDFFRWVVFCAVMGLISYGIYKFILWIEQQEERVCL